MDIIEIPTVVLLCLFQWLVAVYYGLDLLLSKLSKAQVAESSVSGTVAKSETAGLLWDASNSRMLAAIGTLATAAFGNLEISTFDSPIIKSDNLFFVR